MSNAVQQHVDESRSHAEHILKLDADIETLSEKLREYRKMREAAVEQLVSHDASPVQGRLEFGEGE